METGDVSIRIFFHTFTKIAYRLTATECTANRATVSPERTATGRRPSRMPVARDRDTIDYRLRYDEQSVGAGNKKPGPWNARHGDRPKTRTTGQ